MPTVTIEQRNPGVFVLKGELNMQTVPQLRQQALQMLSGLTGKVSIDLSDVTRSDSAGLALLIDWMRLAQAQQLEIQFQHLPQQMLQIARVSELEDLLPIQ